MKLTKLKKIVTVQNAVRLFAVIGVFLVIFLLGRMFGIFSNDEAELVDVRALKAQLVESSELTTAKLKLTCFSEFKDTGLVLFNRSDFIMIYDAVVRAGINLDEVEIPEEQIDYANKIIYVSIPKATIQGEPAIDPESIKYFDEHFSLFNVDAKEDSNKAQALAQDRAKLQAEQSGLLKMADKQSEVLVIGLLSKIAPKGYTIEAL